MTDTLNIITKVDVQIKCFLKGGKVVTDTMVQCHNPLLRVRDDDEGCYLRRWLDCMRSICVVYASRDA